MRARDVSRRRCQALEDLPVERLQTFWRDGHAVLAFVHARISVVPGVSKVCALSLGQWSERRNSNLTGSTGAPAKSRYELRLLHHALGHDLPRPPESATSRTRAVSFLCLACR